jgi:hypothetical protein
VELNASDAEKGRARGHGCLRATARGSLLRVNACRSAALLPMTELVVAPADNESAPRTRRPPDARAIPVPFAYAPSDDGTDENLLILLHGLGPCHVSRS